MAGAIYVEFIIRCHSDIAYPQSDVRPVSFTSYLKIHDRRVGPLGDAAFPDLCQQGATEQHYHRRWAAVVIDGAEPGDVSVVAQISDTDLPFNDPWVISIEFVRGWVVQLEGRAAEAGPLCLQEGEWAELASYAVSFEADGGSDGESFAWYAPVQSGTLLVDYADSPDGIFVTIGNGSTQFLDLNNPEPGAYRVERASPGIWTFDYDVTNADSEVEITWVPDMPESFVVVNATRDADDASEGNQAEGEMPPETSSDVACCEEGPLPSGDSDASALPVGVALVLVLALARRGRRPS